MGESTPTHSASAPTSPASHHDVGTSWWAGATSRMSEAGAPGGGDGAPPALRPSCEPSAAAVGRCWRSDAHICPHATRAKAVRASDTIKAIATHSTQPCAPVVKSSMGPGAQPRVRARGPRTAHAVRAPKSMEKADRGPMIIPWPTSESCSRRVHFQCVAARQPTQLATGSVLVGSSKVQYAPSANDVRSERLSARHGLLAR
mmetsp:Transcript_7744/g.20219  ORF Transcript_7744/g.20219 Transcript_7744/m.20219 type:complete len:202 (-) Transcript_7744:720-1325(-)